MIKLIVPSEEYLQSYTEAYYEYAENHVSTYSFTDPSSCDIFEKFDNYRNERNLRPGRGKSAVIEFIDEIDTNSNNCQ